MTNDYRYRLDNSRPRIKVTCPACGRQKKLVRYIDTQTGRFLADHVGKCDRIFKCGYHYTPSDYFRDHPWLNDIASHRPVSLHINKQPSQPSFIERSRMVESMNRCQSSALFRFLSSRWGEDETMRMFRLHNVGATTRMNDAAVFWQVDINGCIRTGKIMRYGNDGHRIKEDGLVNFMWAHRMKSMVDNTESHAMLLRRTPAFCLSRFKGHDSGIREVSDNRLSLLSAVPVAGEWRMLRMPQSDGFAGFEREGSVACA